MNTSNNINQLCKVVANTFNLPVFLINSHGDIMLEYLINKPLNPLYQNNKENFFKVMNFDPKIEYGFPIIIKNNLSEKFIAVSIFNNELFRGTILVGPFVSYSICDKRINGIINDTRSFSIRDKMFHYYQSLPNIKHETVLNMGILIFHTFNNILLSPETVNTKNKELFKSQESNQEVNMIISNKLQNHMIQHDRQFEKQILNIVKEGKVTELDNFQMMKEEEDASVLSKSSHMRSVKNHIITLITLVSLAAIDGGLDHEIAITLRDEFILQLEDLNSIKETRKLARTVLYTYTEKVLQIKNEGYSKTIANCVNFINKNIYENITLNDLSEMIDLSPKYLSVLFKKEVGMTISKYIQKAKIEEAKKLLSYSSNTILDISSLLNFTDQSYFTKIFKKYVGVTPKVYRETHYLLKN